MTWLDQNIGNDEKTEAWAPYPWARTQNGRGLLVWLGIFEAVAVGTSETDVVAVVIDLFRVWRHR